MSVEVTEGEAAWDVFIRPWTIQGCRPLSVSSHPAVFIRNGAMTNQGAIEEEPLGLLQRLPADEPQPPQARTAAISAAR